MRNMCLDSMKNICGEIDWIILWLICAVDGVREGGRHAIYRVIDNGSRRRGALGLDSICILMGECRAEALLGVVAALEIGLA
jgi:hypothetical protein